MGMDSFFDAVITFDDTGKTKPDEAPFRAALKKLGVKPEEAVMVGAGTSATSKAPRSWA